MALGNGGGDLGSEGVLDAHQGYEGEILLYLLGCILLPTPLLTLCTALEGHKDVPICNGKRPAQQQLRSDKTAQANSNWYWAQDTCNTLACAPAGILLMTEFCLRAAEIVNPSLQAK